MFASKHDDEMNGISNHLGGVNYKQMLHGHILDQVRSSPANTQMSTSQMSLTPPKTGGFALEECSGYTQHVTRYVNNDHPGGAEAVLMAKADHTSY